MQTRIAVWLVPLLTACGGAGDWGAYEPDPSVLPKDKIETESYPSGPYGTKVGEVIDDLAFDKAFFDPETHCKKAVDLDLTTNHGVGSLSLSEIRRGDAYCPARKKQFLWLIASAGW